MPETRDPADEALAHSEDENEWDDQPEQIVSRPSGTQVISARLPSALAETLLAEAARQGTRPSELVRQAVEAFLSKEEANGVADLSAYAGYLMRVVTPIGQYSTENSNLVVDVPAEPAQVVAVAKP